MAKHEITEEQKLQLEKIFGRARVAEKIIETYDQERVDRMCRCVAWAAGNPRERQALAGAPMAFEAQPKASINVLKRLGPSSGMRCKRRRASSSAGEISAVGIADI